MQYISEDLNWNIVHGRNFNSVSALKLALAKLINVGGKITLSWLAIVRQWHEDVFLKHSLGGRVPWAYRNEFHLRLRLLEG